MYHQYKFDRSSPEGRALIVGTNKTLSPNLLPQKNTKCPFPFNRLRIGESLWFHHKEMSGASINLAIESAKRFNKTYQNTNKGDMFAFVEHYDTQKTEIVRIR